MIPSPEALITNLKNEVHSLVERLPLSSLQSFRDQIFAEIQKLEASPEVQATESRFKSVVAHLWARLMQGEHAAITEVHEFLLKKEPVVPNAPANVVPMSPADRLPDCGPAPEGSTPANDQAVS